MIFINQKADFINDEVRFLININSSLTLDIQFIQNLSDGFESCDTCRY